MLVVVDAPIAAGQPWRRTILTVTDMLSLAGDLPEVAFAPGDLVIREGDDAGAIWVLMSGKLRVRKGATPVTHLIAVGLAERLGDAPGLSMVDTVLTRLAHRQVAPARSGPARDPDPEY